MVRQCLNLDLQIDLISDIPARRGSQTNCRANCDWVVSLEAARLATALPLSEAASRRASVCVPQPCRQRAARARCPPSLEQRPRASRCLREAAPGPQPPPAPQPRGCHAGCWREPLRAALLRPSFRRSDAVLAQHTTAVKQSAPPRRSLPPRHPKGDPAAPPGRGGALYFTARCML